MHLTTETANQAYEILTQHFKIAKSKPAERYFRETAMIKKKCRLDEISGEGLTWWNLYHNKSPFVEYSGTDSAVASAVTAANQKLHELFPESKITLL